MTNKNNNGHINTFDALVDMLGEDLKTSNIVNKCNCDSCRASLRKRIIKDLKNELENSKNSSGSYQQGCQSINHCCPIILGPRGSTGALSQIFLEVSGAFTAQSSYTMIVQQWGGGAGGSLAKVSGPTGNFGGGGGGAGGYASYQVSVSKGQVFVYTIGGVASPGMNGNATTFSGGLIVGIVQTQGGNAPTSSLGGGGGSVANVPTDGIGFSGGNGGSGFPQITIIPGPEPNIVDILGGKGGDTFAGPGGPGGDVMSSGKSGDQPGGGGGGGGGNLEAVGDSGGGAAGLIILTVSTATFP
ncbi:MAG: hypothetical protein Hyperionvirus3_104 [Hyperionvirus sp.]|uniref:Uncharacterized protein n=1 Tax=Hyperionvirus sp. TaxID=2487770 RepID=A0A3G5A707_9VIRU|nr:MAG: hypothetical protein Hyperionvirus3_104 [Hyperionvirus sp.]